MRAVEAEVKQYSTSKDWRKLMYVAAASHVAEQVRVWDSGGIEMGAQQACIGWALEWEPWSSSGKSRAEVFKFKGLAPADSHHRIWWCGQTGERPADVCCSAF